jgi:peroxiredoxin
MKKIIYLLLILSVQVLAMPHGLYCASQEVGLKKSFMSFSEVEFPESVSAEQATYLGTVPGHKVKLSGVKADVIILEVFNIYCYHCQRQVPNMNELYRLINKANLSGKIKIIGVAMSNTEIEVGIFKKKFNVFFPIFSDPDNSLYRVAGRGEAPYLNVLKSDGRGNIEKLYAIERNLPEAEKLLNSIMESSGINMEAR